MRCALLVAIALAAWPSRGVAQPVAPVAPSVQPLSPDELTALEPLADRGAAILVRNATEGIRARITVLLHVHAPLATLHDVIATPEQYPQFMTSIDHLDVLSRHGTYIAVRMHTSLLIFSVDTDATLHLIGPRRVDGTLTHSQLGPGEFRWDIYQAGDDCYLAYTAWNDPTQASWFIRAAAATSPSAIAGVEMSYNVMLAMIVRRRAENLAGHSNAGMPDHAAGNAGDIAPPPAGPWSALTGDRVVASVTLDAQGSVLQATTAMGTTDAPATLLARFRDPANYPHVWSDIHTVQAQPPRPDGTVRFHSVVDSTLFHTEGDQDLSIATADHPVITWRGASGDYTNDVMRWDLVPSGTGTVVMLSGGGDLNRTGTVMRTLVGRVPWMLPGYAAALKLVWIQRLLGAH